jgi:hypothetical protein
VRVRYSGEYHEVWLLPGGALAPPDHTTDHVCRHRALMELGGEPCGCVAVLAAWKDEAAEQPEVWPLPRRLARALREARRRGDKRRARARADDREAADAGGRRSGVGHGNGPHLRRAGE